MYNYFKDFSKILMTFQKSFLKLNKTTLECLNRKRKADIEDE